MYELALELKARGHEVTVITTWPEYNLDQDSNVHSFLEKEYENGITVLRVKSLPHHNVNYLVRGIAQMLMPLQFLWKLSRHQVRSEACIIYSPPLPLALVGIGLKSSNVKSLLNLQDLFPQNAIDLGVMRQPLMIWFFRALEFLSYRFSDVITLHSEGNRKTVLAQYPQFSEKLNILHNWVDLEHHQEREPRVDFREKWSLKHPLIAIFAGVMGPSQYLKLMLQVADYLQEEKELLFLLVGGGTEKEKLMQSAKDKKLVNVRFENFVSREVYPDLLSICNLGLVCLSPLNQTPVVPGKILGYMAAGLPVAAFLHQASDGHAIIKDAGCGITADSADAEICIQAFKGLIVQKHKFKHIGHSGRKYAAENFSKEECVSQMESLLRV